MYRWQHEELGKRLAEQRRVGFDLAGSYPRLEAEIERQGLRLPAEDRERWQWLLERLYQDAKLVRPKLTKVSEAGGLRASPDAETTRRMLEGRPSTEKPGGEKRWDFPGLHISLKMHAIVAASVGTDAASRIDWDKFYDSAARAYADRDQPTDLLADLKKRAREFERDQAEAACQARYRREQQEREAAWKREEERRASLSPAQREAERALRRALLANDSAGVEAAQSELAKLAQAQ